MARYGITGFLVTGCEIKISRREQDLLIFADGKRNSFKIEHRMQDEKWKI